MRLVPKGQVLEWYGVTPGMCRRNLLGSAMWCITCDIGWWMMLSDLENPCRWVGDVRVSCRGLTVAELVGQSHVNFTGRDILSGCLGLVGTMQRASSGASPNAHSTSCNEASVERSGYIAPAIIDTNSKLQNLFIARSRFCPSASLYHMHNNVQQHHRQHSTKLTVLVCVPSSQSGYIPTYPVSLSTHADILQSIPHAPSFNLRAPKLHIFKILTPQLLPQLPTRSHHNSPRITETAQLLPHSSLASPPFFLAGASFPCSPTTAGAPISVASAPPSSPLLTRCSAGTATGAATWGEPVTSPGRSCTSFAGAATPVGPAAPPTGTVFTAAEAAGVLAPAPNRDREGTGTPCFWSQAARDEDWDAPDLAASAASRSASRSSSISSSMSRAGCREAACGQRRDNMEDNTSVGECCKSPSYIITIIVARRIQTGGQRAGFLRAVVNPMQFRHQIHVLAHRLNDCASTEWSMADPSHGKKITETWTNL